MTTTLVTAQLQTPDSLSNLIRTYENIVPADVCDALVAQFEKDTAYHERHTNPAKTPQFTQLNLSQAMQIGDPFWKEHNMAMAHAINNLQMHYEADIGLNTFPEKYGFEELRLKRYSPETQDEFGIHVDVGTHATARRFLVVFFYLNDVAEGGETYFPHLGIKIKPKKGMALVFPPLWLYPHAGLPPVSGPKYIVGSYLHYVD